MAQADDIRHGMQVIGSDGGMVGAVDGVEGGSIKLQRAPEVGGGQHHFIPLDWVGRVDEHVHLTIDAATVRDRWTAETGAGAYVAPPLGIEERRTSWLPWLIGLVVLALLLFLGLRSCDNQAVDPGVDANETATTDAAVATAALPLGQAGAYLAGSDPVPATFAFEKLNFDTSSAEIRAADQDEVAQLATVLKNHPTATIRLVGFADARGTDPANATLGQQRADAVKAALVSAGVDAAHIETATGGEEAPTATNATAEGQFENRRTEVVVLSR